MTQVTLKGEMVMDVPQQVQQKNGAATGCTIQWLPCKSCNKVFQDRGALNRHTRTHTGEKPFCCKVCSRAFSQKGHLTSHMRTHTGERPFKCNQCPRSFSQSNNLTRHTRTHTGHRPFSCRWCGRSFGQKIRLKSHLRTHHDYMERRVNDQEVQGHRKYEIFSDPVDIMRVIREEMSSDEESEVDQVIPVPDVDEATKVQRGLWLRASMMDPAGMCQQQLFADCPPPSVLPATVPTPPSMSMSMGMGMGMGIGMGMGMKTDAIASFVPTKTFNIEAAMAGAKGFSHKLYGSVMAPPPSYDICMRGREPVESDELPLLPSVGA